MPRCPVCHFPLQKPPRDPQEWFRCENCKTPLRLPSEVARIAYVLSVCAVIGGQIALGELVGRNHTWISKLLEHFWKYILGGLAVSNGFLGYVLWRTKIGAPRIYDPYSSLNLSDERKLRRGG